MFFKNTTPILPMEHKNSLSKKKKLQTIMAEKILQLSANVVPINFVF